MPSSLPDPVLALSLASVQKLNNVDLDQLANLWNVFTKCKESLESGRRLENLSWRLWFREAHLLPPDTSLSDLADFTPLDTPLMSRRGSITGSFPTARPTVATLPSLVSVDGQLAAVNDASLSDPEDGNWSDDDNDARSEQEAVLNSSIDSRGRTPTRTEASLLGPIPVVNEVVPAKVSAPVNNVATLKPTKAETSTIHADGLISGGLPGGSLDRKRAVSSSSAFGSRARVRQHNTARRRRPLSFQQAIESLLDRSKDFRHNGNLSQSPSFREGTTADVGVDTNGHDWRNDGLISGDQAVAMVMEQNSAPAEFNQVNAPSVKVISPAISPAPQEVSRLEEERRSMPPPLAFPIRKKEAPKEVDADDERKRKESKFFMAGQSVDDSASSMSGSLVPSVYSPKQKEPHNSLERPAQRRAPSEAASDQGQRLNLSQRGQQQQPHSHGHTKTASHGITASGRNRSGVGLSRASAAPAAAKGKAPGRVASGGSTGSSRRADGQSVEQEADSSKITKSEKEVEAKNGTRPVKFTLSGGDDGDDEFTDDDSEEEEQRPQQRASNSSKRGPTMQGRDSKEDDDEEEEDEWSSASSTDSEELQRRVVARRKQEEIERQQSMFQKKPIKSASTADVRSVERRSSAPIEGSNDRAPVSPVQPVRGLLSSLFHPEEGPHPPPGQLAGRPHASAADLRMKPSKQKESRPQSGRGDFRMTAMPSTTQVPSIGGGALKLSKSAVALPVLSTMGSRSEAKKGHEAKGSRDSAVFDEEESAGSSEAGGQYGTSEALARLNQLAYHKKERQREGKRQNKNRQSNRSLNVEVAPEIDEEAMMADRRREAVATPLLAGSRAESQIPETSMPQTPRTTRRNMLRDELSESLRQSLLWERQSRNRMLGIGALDSNPRNNQTTTASDHRSRSMNRNQTVLGGGQLRPLTTSSSATNVVEQQQQRQQQQRRSHQQSKLNTSEGPSNNNANTAHRSYTGDFHHAGW